jgi:hypothetical protein
MDNLYLEPVLQEKGWTLIYYNNLLCIKKSHVYYSLSSMYKFKGQPFVETDPSLQYLGEYIPVSQHNSFFASLPMVVQNNSFFVNQKTNIVYIKPLDLAIMVPNRIPYQLELYSNYTFGGVYHPYMNSTSTSGKLFLDILPKAVAPKKTVPPPPMKLNHEHVVENTLTQYPTPKQVVALTKTIVAQPPEPITFLIPFLHYTSNIEALIKTLGSIITHVKENRIILITNIDPTDIPLDIRKMIYINNYNRYVGKLGIENTLNLKMNNKYDVVNFYHFLITTYVKTNFFTVWQPHWEIKSWNMNLRKNTSIIIPNFYQWKDERYRSQKYGRMGYVVSKTTRFSSTIDGQDVVINGMGVQQIDPAIVVEANFEKNDFDDRKNMLLYGNEIEMRQFYEQMEAGKPMEGVEKVIQ